MRLVFGTLDLPDTDVAPRLLDRYAGAGGRVLDVANVDRDGEASRAVGRWLARGPRDRVALYAKGCHPPHCRPDLVTAEIDKSRTFPDVDWIDVFILHRDDLSYPVSAWVDALLAEVDAGRIGAFGVSNWTIERARELRTDLDAQGGDHLRAFSNHVMHQPDYVLPVVGTTSEAHLEEALGAGTIRLDQAEVAWLENDENR